MHYSGGGGHSTLKSNKLKAMAQRNLFCIFHFVLMTISQKHCLPFRGLPRILSIRIGNINSGIWQAKFTVFWTAGTVVKAFESGVRLTSFEMAVGGGVGGVERKEAPTNKFSSNTFSFRLCQRNTEVWARYD